jgi:hypothetical protein
MSAFRKIFQQVAHRIRAISRRQRIPRKALILLALFVGLPALSGTVAVFYARHYRNSNLLHNPSEKKYAKGLPTLKAVKSDSGTINTGQTFSFVANKLPASIAQALAAPAATIVPNNQKYASSASGGDPSTPTDELAPAQQKPSTVEQTQLASTTNQILTDWDSYDSNLAAYEQKLTPLLSGSLVQAILNHNDDILPEGVYPGGQVSQTYLSQEFKPDDPLLGMKIIIYEPGTNAEVYLTVDGYVHRSSSTNTQLDNTLELRGYGLVLKRENNGQWQALRIAAEDRNQVVNDGLPVPLAGNTFSESAPSSENSASAGQSVLPKDRVQGAGVNPAGALPPTASKK